MEKCIYLDSNENLSFNKQEHVLPAGLGCIDKLKKGLVSDQANEIFSKFELEFLEKTPLGFIRKMNIGKRGNLNKPVPNVVCSFENNDMEPKLFLNIFGQTYGISQLKIIGNDSVTIYAPSKCEGELFFKMLKTITSDTRFTFDIIPNCKEETIIITYCNNKWYCYYNNIITEQKQYKEVINIVVNEISQLPNEIGEGQIIAAKKEKKDIHVGNILSTSAFISEYRVIIKSVINSLAFLFGREIVDNELLKQMKLFALGRTDNPNVVLKRWIIESDENLKTHPHRIKFYYDKVWHCTISLFEEWFYDCELPIDLSPYLNTNISKEYIIDWENRDSIII